jgi:toxin ParE1/3/4
MTPRWKVSLTTEARRDLVNILRWTLDHFGKGQTRVYDKTIRSALRDLARGPDIVGCRQREDISPGIHTLHVARHGRKGRHFVVFRVTPASDNAIIEVLRLLHDSMDLPRYLPAANESGTPDDPQH